MPRAVRALAAVLALMLAPGVAGVDEIEPGPSMVDGIGMIDYGGRPNFKIGSWVKYRTASNSLKGASDDYTVTIQIAGEQVLWGEPCVWVESWTSRPGDRERATASLVSYAAFQDTMPFWHIEWFMRLIINDVDEKGRPDYRMVSRENAEFGMRKVNWDAEYKDRARVDTLGSEKVTIDLGTFDATKVVRRTGWAQTQDQGDSTYYYRRNGFETYYVSRQIPITSIVKIDIEDIQQSKTWKAGAFSEDSLLTLERGLGTTMLVGYGDSGLKPRLVPEAVRRPIANRKLVEEFVNLPAETAVKRYQP